MIWVWGENGPDAALESVLTRPPVAPELEDKEKLESGKVIDAGISHGDVAYGWDTFMVRRRKATCWYTLRTFSRFRSIRVVKRM